MSKRNATNGPYDYNDDEDYVPTKKIQYSSKDKNPIHNKKHTLDSDEEDEDTKAEGKNYDVLKDEDIDGQEDSTIDFEGETKITPFNMKEELEEGHFDKDGFYHFKKESDQLKDAWLDNIDWIKIKSWNKTSKVFRRLKKGRRIVGSLAECQNKLKDLDTHEKCAIQRKCNARSSSYYAVKHQVDGIKNYGSDDDSLDSNHIKTKEEIAKEQKEEFVLYEEIFPYLQQQETIAMALKRFGGGKKKRLTTAERWKLKKQGKAVDDGGNDMETFMKVTEIANKIVETGNIDVYEETYEMINIKMQRYKASQQPKISTDPSFDMFSEEASSAVNTDATNVTEPSSAVDATETVKEDTTPVSDVRWEYRWEDKEDAEIHGPFTSEQMVMWKDSDFFKNGVFVRKVTERAGPWYNSSRIDFELYT